MMEIFHRPCYHRQQHPQSENCPVITKKRLTNKYIELSDQILHNKFGNWNIEFATNINNIHIFLNDTLKKREIKIFQDATSVLLL